MQAGLNMQICLRPTILGEMCNVFPKRLIMDHYLGGLHVFYSLLQLAPGLRDLSQAEKRIIVM